MPEFEVAVVRGMRVLERIDGSTLEDRFLSRDEDAMTLTPSMLGDR
jgi:hypothetical protein